MAQACTSIDADTRAKCIQVFGQYVKKEKAKSDLSEAEMKIGKGTTVKKILQSIGQDKAVNKCDASILPKYQDKKTKTISAEDFVDKVLPDLAGSPDKLSLWAKKIADQLETLQSDKTKKDTGVVGRLTDTSKYTGSHQERFDSSGKGKGTSGRKDIAANDGYVQGYKEKDSYDKK